MTKNNVNEKMSTLIVGAIGIVYGDIGTSPLYSLKSCFLIGGLQVTQDAILGIISLFIWALILIVSLKYVRLVLTMDHNGEGGVLTLSSLASSLCSTKSRSRIIFLGIIGAALFFGDGIITPAISVLSAVEGISLISNQFSAYIIPITVIILTLLFAIQKFGSGKIGRFFGPIMVLWFGTLLTLGIYHIIQSPYILMALNPYYAFNFLVSNSWVGLITMGGVILVVTGAEALYADLGHFGKVPIQRSWAYFVFPALAANYLGQGALLLKFPEAIVNPFYLMVPSWALQPVIILATLATIIASQAIISGLFSVACQSILLNYLPRMKVTNTSAKQMGQVYIPAINYLVYLLTLSAVLKFGSSEKLAVAYGFCVASIMLITTTLIFVIALENWRWHWVKLTLVFAPLFFLDCLFVGTNLMKFFEGAWYAVAITLVTYYIIYTWIKGNRALQEQKIVVHTLAKNFIENHLHSYPNRIPGTAIFLCRKPFKIPSSLVMQLHHNKYLHEKVIFLSLITKDVPYQKPTERFTFTFISSNVSQVIACFGFKEIPDINKLIQWLKENNIIEFDESISIFLGRGIPIATKSQALSGFSEKLYIILASLAQNATDFYRIPHHKVIELGVRYKI